MGATFKRRYLSSKRSIIVLTVFFLLVALGIGYAYLTSNLTIQGTAEITKNTWDVHFENIVPDPNNVSATKDATISSDKMQVDFDVSLNLPGDEYNFTVDVVNNGTIPAMLNLVELVGITEAQQKYLEYQVLYQDGDPLVEKDALPVGKKETYQVHIKYKDDITKNDLPTENQTVSLSLKSNYVQDDGTAKERLKEVVLKKAVADSGNIRASNTNTNFLDGPLAKDTIETIEFVTYQEAPSDAIASWDVSEKQNGSIMAYYYDQDGDGKYEVYIGCSENSKILANSDSSYLFQNLTMVTSIDLGKLDTSQATNMSYMFGGCSRLTSLDLSNFDTSKVTDMSNMFYGNSLTSLDLSNFDTSKVTDMSSMFVGDSLTSLNLSNFDTSQVKNMKFMFYGNSLTSLDLSNFDTSQVTDMSFMFFECNSLTSLNLSNFDTSQVKNMKFMFSGNSLTSLALNNFDTSQVTNMSWMFDGCSSLTSLDLSNFDTSQVTDMSWMFGDCSNLTSLNISTFDTSKVTSMGGLFDNCSKLITTITIRKVNGFSSMPNAATEPGAQITLNYTADTSDLVDNAIENKDENSNIVKGSLVS